jgi:hypothetical protein
MPVSSPLTSVGEKKSQRKKVERKLHAEYKITGGTAGALYLLLAPLQKTSKSKRPRIDRDSSSRYQIIAL